MHHQQHKVKPRLVTSRVWLLLCLLGIAGCGDEGPVSEKADTRSVSSMGKDHQDGEWLLHGLSQGEQRYSPLARINANNVNDLALAFEYRDFVVRGRTERGLQATPLMDDGTLYFTGPWDVVYAVDARTGEERWVYDPDVDGARARVACCDVVNRGVALRDENVFVATTDGYLVALEKGTGEEVWKTNTFVDRTASYTITGAPRLAGNLVVIGNGGAEMGVRGYVSAYEIETGDLEWRFYTIPGAGQDETIDIARARKTWSDNMPWEYGGGGTVWDSMVYDEKLGMLYIGVGNGGPWPAWERGDGAIHDNLYLSSIVALDAETGLAKWHYQTTPGDSWDYTATQHMILADMEWDGEVRQLIMQAPKNGFFYVLDRESGELLSAEPFVPVSWASGVDMATGRPILKENANYSKQDRVITPAPGGAHNWPPMALNLDTNLVYIPAEERSGKYATYDDGRGYLSGSRNTRALSTFPNAKMDADLLEGLPPLRLHSQVIAWDPVRGEAVWKSESQLPFTGGLLTTAGNLVLSGSSAGFFNVFHAETGALLKSIEVGTMITAPPMAYELDGEQYIAVLAGAGGVALGRYHPEFAPVKYRNQGRLLVFKLGGNTVPLAPLKEAPIQNAIPAGLPSDAETLLLGQEQFERHCVRCHQPRGFPSGYPDLWNMSPETDEMFNEIVLDGVMEYGGMAEFSDILTSEDALAIRAYIAADREKVRRGEVQADRIQLH